MIGPFSCIGLDFFGPLYVKNGRKTEKRYGLIFVCMSVRAIHVEMTERLTTDSTLNVSYLDVAILLTFSRTTDNRFEDARGSCET